MIEIVYTGTLDAFDPDNPKYKKRMGLTKYFLPYNSLTTSPHTRSGYFLFKAIEKALGKVEALNEKLHFSFYGSIDHLNMRQVKSLGIENLVSFHGYLSKKELAKVEEKADAFFLPIESGSEDFQRPLFIPGKLFEYMKWEKPILCLTGPSDVKDILEKAGLGICLPPDNTEEISSKLIDLTDEVELRRIIQPNKDYIASFAFDKITAQYAELIRELL